MTKELVDLSAYPRIVIRFTQSSSLLAFLISGLAPAFTFPRESTESSPAGFHVLIHNLHHFTAKSSRKVKLSL
jgi:hypothetical protein